MNDAMKQMNRKVGHDELQELIVTYCRQNRCTWKVAHELAALTIHTLDFQIPMVREGLSK